MPPKRIWIPILCLLILGGLIYYVYQQLPNRARHDFIAVSTGSAVTPVSSTWLRRHQSNDGRWSATYYQFYCDEKEARTGALSEFCAAYYSDISYTSLALLSYLGAGYDHKTPGKHKQTVIDGLQWLLTQQSDNGWLSSNNREQALACVALAEAYAMTMDPQLKQPAQLAFEQLKSRLLQRSVNAAVMGWSSHAAEKNSIDFSVTAWGVMAAKSIKSAGLDVGDVWEDLKASYQQVWIDQKNNKMSSDDQLHFPQQLNIGEGLYVGVDDISGSLAAVFLGRRLGDEMLDVMHASVLKMLLGDLSDLRGDEAYMGNLVIFQYGGSGWKEYSLNRSEFLTHFVKTSTCEEGSAPLHCFRDGNKFLDTLFLYLMSQIYSR